MSIRTHYFAEVSWKPSWHAEQVNPDSCLQLGNPQTKLLSCNFESQAIHP